MATIRAALRRLAPGCAAASLFWSLNCFAAEQAADTSFYAADQASTGRTLYVQHCAICHGNALEGGEAGPALRGHVFADKLAGKPARDLFEQMRRTMPVTQPGGLTGSQYTALFAYVLYGNGFAAGKTPLDIASVVLDRALPAAPGGAFAAVPPRPESATRLVSVPLTEWLHHRGDAGSSNYSALEQINRDTIARLTIAWRWRSDNFGPTIWPNFEATPLMADGVLYATAGSSRTVIAIDARNGETLWIYRLEEGARGQAAPRKGPGRGLALWRDAGRDTLFVISPGYQLVALNAKTGHPVESFGASGIVDLKRASDPPLDSLNAPIGASSPPIVVGDVVIVGSAFSAGAAPPRKEMPTGHVMGFDVRTGKRLWVFHTIARAGDVGADTWSNDARSYTGNTGVWAPISADVERGLVYLPIEAPTGDFYGGHRPGDNLYADSLVCIDARTGERKWHFQLVHHDIWDYDTPAPPVLLDITAGGKRIAAVAQVTKQGHTYVFDRITGKPVWPIIERAVPQSDVPGEVTSRTQPIPTLPQPFERQGVTEDSLNNMTPEIFAEAKKIAARYRMGPLFTPPSVVTESNGGTLQVPGSQGGANWQGAVADPESGILYVPSTSTISLMGMGSDPQRSNMRYILAANSRTTGPFGLPLARPPWGTIVAIDLNTGKRLWTVANGDTPDTVRNHEKLRDLKLPRTGHDDRAGLLVTKSLLFAGEGAGMFVASQGGTKFRAHDKRTGDILWEMDLGLRQTGIPMTYAVDGKQYIVVPTGAPGSAGAFIALALGD
jgi:quinoprotein glucose dehydrogenase